MWAFTYESENGTRMSIGRFGLNTTYTNLDTGKHIKVTLGLRRFKNNRMEIRRYINDKLHNTIVYNFNNFQEHRVASQEAALANFRYYSDRIVMKIFEVAA